MTQLDVLLPLLHWRDASAIERSRRHHRAAARHTAAVRGGMTGITSPTISRRVRATASWIRGTSLNALIKLPWVAYLTGDDSLKRLFFTASAART
ncbi:MAG: hypothetical protein U0521_01875 [Anaerolineae bacterium]